MARSDETVNPTAGSLLGFLATFGPMTGWDLDRAVEASIGNFWNVTRSQIYRELRDLETRGLVAPGPPGPRDRTPFEITAAGAEALAGWLAGEPGVDIIRHRLMLTVFFADRLPPGRLAEIVAEQRIAHGATLAGYLALQGEIGEQGAMAATLRFGIGYEEMVLAWLVSLVPPGG